MGIHIFLQRVEGDKLIDHPAWDSGRWSGDRDFWTWAGDLPVKNHPVFNGKDPWVEPSAILFRPTDFPAWRAALPVDRDNPERFVQLLNLLEQDEDYWVQVTW